MGFEVDKLPDMQSAKLPATYQQAQLALHNCEKIDECKDWADKAAALASYAKQANDDQLHNMAKRIQGRAMERAGELLLEIAPGYGARTDLQPRDGGGANVVTEIPQNNANTQPHTASDTRLTRTEAATQAGLSKRQKDTAIRIASIPKPELNALIESDTPPTLSKLSEMGTQKKTGTEPYYFYEGITEAEHKASTQLFSALSHMLRAAGEVDIKMATKGLTKSLREEKLKDTQNAYLIVTDILREFNNVQR